MIISDLQIIMLLDYAVNYAAELAKKENIDQATIDYARCINSVVHEIKYQQSNELKEVGIKT